MTKVEELLLRLVKIPSMSGDEQKLLLFIENHLRALGLDLERQEIAQNRWNIIARKGRERCPWLLAHTDTVEGEVDVSMTEDKIFGRGATDNKSNVSIMLLLAEELDDLKLCFTVGEESGDFTGAKKAREIIGADLVIAMEQTRCQLISAQRGVIVFRIAKNGKRIHSSIAKRSHNALNPLLDELNKLRKQSWTAFNFGRPDCDGAPNFTSSWARVECSIRPEDKKEFSKFMKNAHRREFEIVTALPPYSNPHFQGGRKVAFTAMGLFPNAIAFGVGNPALAHADDEYILREDLNNGLERCRMFICSLHKR